MQCHYFLLSWMEQCQTLLIRRSFKTYNLVDWHSPMIRKFGLVLQVGGRVVRSPRSKTIRGNITPLSKLYLEEKRKQSEYWKLVFYKHSIGDSHVHSIYLRLYMLFGVKQMELSGRLTWNLSIPSIFHFIIEPSGLLPIIYNGAFHPCIALKRLKAILLAHPAILETTPW